MAKNKFHRDSTAWSTTPTEDQASQGQAAQFFSTFFIIIIVEKFLYVN